MKVFMRYLPRLCNHSRLPWHGYIISIGTGYKRDEDGEVLVSQDVGAVVGDIVFPSLVHTKNLL